MRTTSKDYKHHDKAGESQQTRGHGTRTWVVLYGGCAIMGLIIIEIKFEKRHTRYYYVKCSITAFAITPGNVSLVWIGLAVTADVLTQWGLILNRSRGVITIHLNNCHHASGTWDWQPPTQAIRKFQIEYYSQALLVRQRSSTGHRINSVSCDNGSERKDDSHAMRCESLLHWEIWCRMWLFKLFKLGFYFIIVLTAVCNKLNTAVL